MMPIVTSAVRRGQQRKEDSAKKKKSPLSSYSLAGSVAADARGRRNVYNLP